MPNKERIRETVSGLPTLEHLVSAPRRAGSWRRRMGARVGRRADIRQHHPMVEEIPYGLRVSDDCSAWW